MRLRSNDIVLRSTVSEMTQRPRHREPRFILFLLFARFILYYLITLTNMYPRVFFGVVVAVV